MPVEPVYRTSPPGGRRLPIRIPEKTLKSVYRFADKGTKSVFAEEIAGMLLRREKMNLLKKIGFVNLTLSLLVCAGAFISTGCAVYTNGMTLPNPYYMKNRVQYFPRGPEFPFSNEAAVAQESHIDPR